MEKPARYCQIVAVVSGSNSRNCVSVVAPLSMSLKNAESATLITAISQRGCKAIG